MRPLQLWIPALVANPQLLFVREDRDAAYRAWDGEAVVWMLPNLPSVRRWTDPDKTRLLAIGTKDFDCVHVYHVGENGFAVGPGVSDVFPGGKVNSLLDAWLNMDPAASAAGLRRVPATLEINLPRFSGPEVEYVKANLEISPRYSYGETTKQAPDEARMTWPAEGFSRQVVSDGDSGPRFRRLFDMPKEDQSVGMLMWAAPHPVRAIMPMLTPFAEKFQRVQMVEIAQCSQDDPGGTLDAARKASSDYISTCTVPAAVVEFAPILAADGAEGLHSYIRGRYSVNPTDKTPDGPLARLLARTVTVRRVWGPVGLFWSLLLDRLEARQPFLICGACGRIIEARKKKRFCGRNENPACFKSRHAAEQRRSRSRRSPRSQD